MVLTGLLLSGFMSRRGCDYGLDDGGFSFSFLVLLDNGGCDDGFDDGESGFSFLVLLDNGGYGTVGCFKDELLLHAKLWGIRTLLRMLPMSLPNSTTDDIYGEIDGVLSRDGLETSLEF